MLPCNISEILKAFWFCKILFLTAQYRFIGDEKETKCICELRMSQGREKGGTLCKMKTIQMQSWGSEQVQQLYLKLLDGKMLRLMFWGWERYPESARRQIQMKKSEKWASRQKKQAIDDPLCEDYNQGVTKQRHLVTLVSINLYREFKYIIAFVVK